MDKQWFNDEINKIEVPREELQIAITKGMNRARQEKPVKRKYNRRKIAWLAAASVCIGVLGSGFIFPQMNRVLAEVPLIGKMYDYFHDTMGQNLTESKLVTELNQQAVSNGVSVTMRSVYYDGGRISVVFKVDNSEKVRIKKTFANDFYYDFKLFDGSRKWQSSTSFIGKRTEDGWLGNIKIDYPEKELPPNTTLPITITSIGETKGFWKFDIPVKQLENKKINPQQSIRSEDQQHTFNFENITIGKGATTIDYKAIYPLVGENDLARIHKITDDKGNEIDMSTSGIEFGREKVGDHVESEERSIFGKIPDGAEFITIYPFVRLSEKPVIMKLDEKTPFEIKSTRSDFKIIINKVQHKNKRLIVNYTLQNVDTKHISMDELINRGEIMNLKDSAYIDKEFAPIGHVVKGSTVKVLNKKKLQFQATFQLDGEYGVKNFSLKDYVLEVEMSSYQAEKTLPPVQIKVK
ncbi:MULTISPECIES: DUF4179 domain-containing protein [unclassified Bacillus (in: firmicutes)]|uniref:DUF4179 domain-containing protein n=1 Tax=unclassified Bacillus (in: firmicutes) TaxID=185979 RepID=UPI0008F0114F|nr:MULTISPECIES: DUF4179 domain-containing protein [unclassified Bacillus (in: firmicutes)]SFJ15561.1 protein of unknown function [Bacillus sp. 71mf]SFT08878.1 protein of unknown function [Bacillus sp. 103mf]